MGRKRRGRLKRKELARLYGLLGVRQDDAADAIESEVDEDLPQLTTAVLALTLWHEVDRWRDLDTWLRPLLDGRGGDPSREPALDAIRRTLAAGATARDLGEIARMVAADQTFQVLARLDGGHAFDLAERAGEDLPGWLVVEFDRSGKPTGRSLDGLHENFFGWEP